MFIKYGILQPVKIVLKSRYFIQERFNKLIYGWIYYAET